MSLLASPCSFRGFDTQRRIISRGAPPGRCNVGNVLVAISLCSTVTAGLCAFEPSLRHWFIAPVTACGALVAIDAIPWVRGKRDLFDPVSIISVLGIHFFYLAPLLHVYWDYWIPFVASPADWRPWLGWMAVLNCAGLAVYRFVTHRPLSERRQGRPRRCWQVNRRRFFILGFALLAATSVLQALVYWDSGGISGYIDTVATNPEAFVGMGWLFIVCDSSPIVAMMLYVVAAERRAALRTPFAVCVALVCVVCLCFMFGGLRGSRSLTVWAVFWAVGIVNYGIRALSRGAAVVGLFGLLLFMYFYGFYKNVSTDALLAFESSANRVELELATRRSIPALVLGDLARADVQAFELYRLTAGQDDSISTRLGKDVPRRLSRILIPARVWPTRPPTKVREARISYTARIRIETGGFLHPMCRRYR